MLVCECKEQAWANVVGNWPGNCKFPRLLLQDGGSLWYWMVFYVSMRGKVGRERPCCLTSDHHGGCQSVCLSQLTCPHILGVCFFMNHLLQGEERERGERQIQIWEGVEVEGNSHCFSPTHSLGADQAQLRWSRCWNITSCSKRWEGFSRIVINVRF